MQLVAAEYVLDFGHVIKGTQKAGGNFSHHTRASAHVPSRLSPVQLAELASHPCDDHVTLDWYCYNRQCLSCWQLNGVRAQICIAAVTWLLANLCVQMMQVRKFKAVNVGSLPVNFAMDVKAMEKAGFLVTPDKLPTLAAAPTHASVEITVTLQVSDCQV